MTALPEDLSLALRKAKINLATDSPFFATFALNTPMVFDETLPWLAATDGRTIFFGELAAALPQKQLVGLIAHECGHIMMMHTVRSGARDRRICNIAADFVLNHILVGSGFTLPPGGLLDKRYTSSMEEVYDQLIQESENDRQSGGSSMLDKLLEDFVEDCLEPAGGETANEAAQRVRQLIGQSASMARAAGRFPAGLSRFVEQIIATTVPWHEVLAQYMVDTVNRSTETWSRRNRRYYDTYLPAHQGKQLGKLGVILDTSGSIRSEKLQSALGHVQALSELLFDEITVMCADSKVTSVTTIRPGDVISVDVIGGGGTDMCVPLKRFESLETDVVIMITDGYTPWPDQEPPYPLIVCCTTSVNVPVGRVIRLA